VVSLCYAASVGLLWAAREWPRLIQLASLVWSYVLLGGLCGLLRWGVELPAFVAALGALTLIAALWLSAFRPVGVILLSSTAAFALLGVIWGAGFVWSLHVTELTKALMLAGLPLLVVTLPSAAVQTFESLEPLCRSRWRRVRAIPSRAGLGSGPAPMVMLHVPIHAEPPDIVIETLEHLAGIDYPDLRVLVIDNNTSDEALWRPVEGYCERNGERFAFIHVDGLKGAKAGALNLALRLTPSDVDLIGVIDADYHARPDFLRRVVPLFTDQQLGFVQTPHDYRGWKHSRFLTACYWEYRYFFHTTMVSLNERDAALTVGTMCLIRRQALVDAGGWSEWCVTEDSELAIRIHAAGYSGTYITETFGKGLIPESLSAYKKQRFRWTYGPIQELKQHWRMFLPRRWATPSTLTRAQKIHHLNHGLDRLLIGLGALLLPLGLAIIGALALQGKTVALPVPLWVAATCMTTATIALRLLIYRELIGANLRQTFGGLLATAALSYTITLAATWAIITKTMPWRRTPKFPQTRVGLRAINHARAETLMATVLILCVAVAIGAGHDHGLTGMLIIGLLITAANLATAPILAITADRDLPPQSPAAEAVRELRPAATDR
ncbi:MAG TPA: glycosyltransferase, partial [Gaiellales bacterium]|nr:glycosyltransferase [Gaiellales bacterium]